MPIRVYDYHTDLKNVEVHPEIRARFLRLEPGPAGRLHSHDLGGEIFLVLAGRCEFVVEDERITCGPGQLIYVEPRRKHTLQAVGDEPCVVYLSVTPHVEPTHTQYDDAGTRLPPRYGTWRGPDDGDPSPGVPTAEIAARYAQEVQRLAELVHAHADALHQRLRTLTQATAAGTEGNEADAKHTVEELWPSLRTVLQCASAVELAWNGLAPRIMLR